MSDVVVHRRPQTVLEIFCYWCRIANFVRSNDPLEVAIRYGNVDDVLALLDHGRDCARYIRAGGDMKHNQAHYLRGVVLSHLNGYGNNRATILREAAAHILRGNNDAEIMRALNAHLSIVGVLGRMFRTANRFVFSRRNVHSTTEVAHRLVHRRAETAEQVVVRWCRIAGRANSFHPLEAAVCNGNVEDAKAVLDHGRDCALSLGEDNPVLRGYGPQILEGIRYYFNDDRSEFQNLLLAAVFSDNLEMVRYVLSRGFGVQDGRQVYNPLKLAVARGNVEMIRILLEEGVDVSTHNPMFFAAQKGNIENMQMLLRQGAALNSRRDFDFHALGSANKTDAMNVLLDHGANANALNMNGRSALFNAKLYDRPDLAKVLTDRGAVDHGIENM